MRSLLSGAQLFYLDSSLSSTHTVRSSGKLPREACNSATILLITTKTTCGTSTVVDCWRNHCEGTGEICKQSHPITVFASRFSGGLNVLPALVTHAHVSSMPVSVRLCCFLICSRHWLLGIWCARHITASSLPPRTPVLKPAAEKP